MDREEGRERRRRATRDVKGESKRREDRQREGKLMDEIMFQTQVFSSSLTLSLRFLVFITPVFDCNRSDASSAVPDVNPE